MEKLKNILVGIIFILAAPVIAGAGEPSKSVPELIFFHSPSCHACVKAKAECMPAIEEKFKGRLTIIYRDMGDIETYKLLASLKSRYKITKSLGLPIVYCNGNLLSGEKEVCSGITGFIERSLSASPVVAVKYSLQDLVAFFLSFTPWAVISAGLIDGINPCAFAVIIFFISYLSLQGYRKRELLVIGLVFIAAVYLAYFLIGLGLFGFLYRLKGFWLVTKVINYGIGLMCILLGGLAFFDFLKYKRTRSVEGLALQLPERLKNRIHAVIGARYRKQKTQDTGPKKIKIAPLAVNTFITGFLVSILEAVCTGQVYLPTITFILKNTQLKFEALVYLVLYNLMFVVPLGIIFLIALLGVTSEEFTRFFKKNFLLVKMAMVVLFLSFGVYLIWRA
ncbi:MAG: cytochrome c biogenesis protein CcdA [Candidatus Omnitrophota bacterium]|jgi:cytochrome c biogenesis protein CcdA